MKEKPSIFEWVAFWVFIILEIVIFALRIISPTAELSQAENVLFSTFEIVFSLYIGYFIQRIDSMRQFQERLKQYGLSAYRRISDISKSLARAKTEIGLKRKSSTENNAHIFDALNAIIEGIDETVKSSITDWIDIIGEDLKTQEKIQELEANLSIQKRTNAESEVEKNKIENLENEIMVLKSKLPYSLQDLLAQQDSSQLETVDTYLMGMYTVSNSIGLRIKTTNLHDIDLDKVRQGKSYTIIFIPNTKTHFFDEVDVYDYQNTLLGQVINPLGDNRWFFRKLWEIMQSDYAHNSTPLDERVVLGALHVIDQQQNGEMVLQIPVSAFGLG